MAKRLGSPSEVIAMDIETADWSTDENNVSRIGLFDRYILKEESVISRARIVEIAWAIGPADASAGVEVNSALVRHMGSKST